MESSLEEISKHLRALVSSKEGHEEIDDEVEEDEGVHHIDDARFEFMFDTLKRLFTIWLESPTVISDIQDGPKLKLHLWSLLEDGLIHADFRVSTIMLRNIGFISGHSSTGFNIINSYQVKLKYEKCNFVSSELAVQHSLLGCLQDCLSSFCSSEGAKDSDEESIVVSVLQSYLLLLGSPSNQLQLNCVVQQHSKLSSQLQYLVLYQSVQIARLGVELLAKLILLLANQSQESSLEFFQNLVESALACFDPLKRHHDDVRLRAIDLMLLLLPEEHGKLFIKNHKLMHRALDFLKDANRMVRSHTVELVGEFVNNYREYFFMLCEDGNDNSNLKGFQAFLRKMEELCKSSDITDVVSLMDILSQIKLSNQQQQDNNNSSSEDIEAIFSQWLQFVFQRMNWILQKMVGATLVQQQQSAMEIESQCNIFQPLEKQEAMEALVRSSDAVMPSLLHAIHKTLPSIQSWSVRNSECLPLVLQTLVLYHFNDSQRLRSHNQRLKKQLFEILKQLHVEEWLYWRNYQIRLAVDPFLVCVHSIRQQSDRSVIESALQALSRALKQTADVLLKDEGFANELGAGLLFLMKDMSWELRDSCLEFICGVTDQLPSSGLDAFARFLISANLLSPVLNCLDDNESYIRQSAIEVLKNLSRCGDIWKHLVEQQHSKFPEVMFQFAKDSELPPRRSFVDLLQAWLRFPYSFHYLQQSPDLKSIVHSLFVDDDWEVKNKVVEFLAMLLLLRDDLAEHRINMFLFLEGPRLLIKGLQDSDRLVRIQTAECLKRVLEQAPLHSNLSAFEAQVRQINLDQIIEGSSSAAIYGDEDVPITTEATTIDCY